MDTIGPPPSGYNEPGRYPELGDGVVDGTACFNQVCGVSGDTRPLPVATARCSNEQGADFLLWKLQYTGCASSYCTDRHYKRESPCDSGDYTTVDDPWRSVKNVKKSEPFDGWGPNRGKYAADVSETENGYGCSYYDNTGVGADRWYRFIGDGGTSLPLAPPTRASPWAACGYSRPGWLSGWNASSPGPPPQGYDSQGSLPSAADGAVERTVCFVGGGGERETGTCVQHAAVGVVRCPAGPVLWRLPFARFSIAGGPCMYGYCTSNGTV